MNINDNYTLELRGTVKAWYSGTAPKFNQYRFFPSKFGIFGDSWVDSGNNPKGMSLGGRAQFFLTSSQTSASYGVSIPFALSYSWSSNKRTETVNSPIDWQPTKTDFDASILYHTNPLIGSAGSGPGLTSVGVRAQIFPGPAAGGYSGPTITWNVSNEYDDRNATDPNTDEFIPVSYAIFPGLSRTDCGYLNWSN